MSASTHDMHLQAADEGTIWIMCSCGWTESLGYAPLPARPWAALQEHMRSVGREAQMTPFGTLVYVDKGVDGQDSSGSEAIDIEGPDGRSVEESPQEA